MLELLSSARHRQLGRLWTLYLLEGPSQLGRRRVTMHHRKAEVGAFRVGLCPSTYSLGRGPRPQTRTLAVRATGSQCIGFDPFLTRLSGSLQFGLSLAIYL